MVSRCRLLMFQVAILSASLPGFAQAGESSKPSEYRFDGRQVDAYRLKSSFNYSNRYQHVSMPPQLAGRPYAELIDKAARQADIDPVLVHALIFVESGYDPAARSARGAVGLMQLLPETAARYGVSDPARSPEANLRAGTRYLRDMLLRFDGRLELVLAAYNAGENAVIDNGMQIPPFPETQHYVPAVLAKYREWGGSVPPGRIDYFSAAQLGK